MPRLHRPRYADVAATLALVIALGTGGAYAATSLISTHQIANGAITTPKIHNNAVTSTKLAAGVRAQLNRYTFAPWGRIPHGQLVTGVFFNTGESGSQTTWLTENINLPATSSGAIPTGNVLFGTTIGGTSADPRCTGSYSAPTAPTGYACVYMGAAQGFSGIGGWGWLDSAIQHRAFYLQFAESAPNTTFTYYGTWAYRAP